VKIDRYLHVSQAGIFSAASVEFTRKLMSRVRPGSSSRSEARRSGRRGFCPVPYTAQNWRSAPA